MLVEGCIHTNRLPLECTACDAVINNKHKLLLTAGINIIRPSQHDIKRYEGEKESSDDQERESMVKGCSHKLKRQ